MMYDIGCVEYLKDLDTKTLRANWHYLENETVVSGTGVAFGAFNEDFSGIFEISYYDLSGNEISKFDLTITQENKYYLLQWLRNGKIEYSGIGIATDSSLVAGWRKVLNN